MQIHVIIRIIPSNKTQPSFVPTCALVTYLLDPALLDHDLKVTKIFFDAKIPSVSLFFLVLLFRSKCMIAHGRRPLVMHELLNYFAQNTATHVIEVLHDKGGNKLK